MNSDKPTIAVIGGGPAGLIAAEKLAQAGCIVTVYDRKPSLGRKFLMAGRGGLNLTHSEDLPRFLTRYGAAERYLAPMVHDFTPEDLRTWCENLGQETYIGSSGRVFPRAMKASPLLRAWLIRLEGLGVDFKRQYDWLGWNEDDALIFKKPDGSKDLIKPDATLLALGGASWPDLGSDGSWANILSAKGVKINPIKPANCGFSVAWSDHMKRHAGQPLKTISLSVCGQSVPGEIMIAENGIEGGAVYALSSIIRDEIEQQGKCVVHIDLRTNMDAVAITEKLSRNRGRQSFSTWIQKAAGLNNLQTTLLRESFLDIASYTPEQLAKAIKAIPLTLTAPFSIEKAISSAGGVSFESVTENLMIKNMPGVFVAGEMLDWEAPTGGYLLQGCFATGVRATKSILAFNASS